jgi:hypothetical protein
MRTMTDKPFTPTPLSPSEEPQRFIPQDLNMEERKISRELTRNWPLVFEARENEVTKYLIDRYGL